MILTPQETQSSAKRSPAEWLAEKLSRVTSTNDFIAEIDGLRFVAVLFVVILHATGVFLQLQGRPPVSPHWTPGHSRILAVIRVFYLGVQIFFVISGLVVALPFARHAVQGAPKPRLGKYFLRRVTRIEPPYILALLAMYCILRQYRHYLPDLLAGLVYMHQWVFGAWNPINGVTWTLEIEVLFYALAPWFCLIYRVPGRAQRWTVELVLIAGYSYFVHSWLLPFGPPQLYYSLVSALPFFMAGIFLADLYASGAIRRSRSLMWDGIAVIGLAAFLYCQIIQAAYRFFWLSPLMIMMVVVGGIKGHVTNRFLRFRPVTLIGGMCYSIYLWHIPILSMLGSHVRPVPHQLSDTQASLLFCVVAAPLIIVITTPIYYFTEKPFMNGPGSRFIERILRAAYAQFQRKPIVASTEAS